MNYNDEIECVTTKRGGIIKSFAGVLRDLSLIPFQRVTRKQETEITESNYIHLVAETSAEKLLK